MTATHAGTTEPVPERIVLVGCAGAGKTTLARVLAARLGAWHIERDALGDDESPGFAARVAAAIAAAGQRWVFDGAPYNAEALVYPHADTVVALDYPHLVVLRRVVIRSVQLWLTDRAAVALVDAYAPGALGRGDARRPTRRDRRAACPARARPHPPPTVHRTSPGRRLAGPSRQLTR